MRFNFIVLYCIIVYSDLLKNSSKNYQITRKYVVDNI